MSDGMRRELVYLSSHATNRYFIPNWGITLSAMKVTNTEHTAINGNQSISHIPDKRKGRKDSPYGSL